MLNLRNQFYSFRDIPYHIFLSAIKIYFEARVRLAAVGGFYHNRLEL